LKADTRVRLTEEQLQEVLFALDAREMELRERISKCEGFPQHAGTALRARASLEVVLATKDLLSGRPEHPPRVAAPPVVHELRCRDAGESADRGVPQ